jgi:hypothetical protein
MKLSCQSTPLCRGPALGLFASRVDVVVLRGHEQDVVDRAVAHAHVADLQGLGIDEAVDLVAEELPEARRVDVLRRQRGLVQVGAGPGNVVVISENIDSGRRRRHGIPQRAYRAEQAAAFEALEFGAETIPVSICPDDFSLDIPFGC